VDIALIHPAALQNVRSLEEGWSYDPTWRWKEAYSYLVQARTAEVARKPWNFPASEQDHWVAQLFELIAFGWTRNPAIKWSLDLQQSNPLRGGASRLKAMVIAMAPMEQVARLVRAPVEYVETYLKLFYDVIPYLEDPYCRSAFALPYGKAPDENIPAWEVQERLWIQIGYSLGPEGVRKYVLGRTQLSALDRTSLEESIRDCITIKASEYAERLRFNSVGRPCDYERFNMQQQQLTNAHAVDKGSTKDATPFILGILGAMNEAQLPPALQSDLRALRGETIEVEAEVTSAPAAARPRQLLFNKKARQVRPDGIPLARTF